MADLTLYPYGLITNQVSIYAGGEDTGYPIENLTDFNWNTFWQNDNNDEEVILDFDMGLAISVNYLILANHNLNDNDYGIKFSAGHGGIGSSYVADAYVIGSSGAFHDYSSDDGNIWIEEYTLPATYQYFRLTIENKSGTKPYIGIIGFGGNKLLLTANYSFGSSKGYVNNNDIFETDGGIQYLNNLWSNKLKWSLKFDDLSETDKGYLDTFIQYTRGSFRPFFIKFIDGTEYYVRLTQDELIFDETEYQLYNTQMNLLQIT
jgi:hypothetical protein